MALFSTKEKNTEKTEKVEADKKTKAVASPSKLSDSFVSLDHVLIAPRITEKATFSADKNVYVFDVAKTATKHQIKMAVAEVYKVTPVRVSVTSVPSKKVFVRGKKGVKSGGKKAYVYLAKKDKIEIV